MKSYFEDKNVVALKADRDADPAVDELLIKLGNKATAIPYYAVYRPGEEPLHFNGIFVNSSQMLEKISPYVGEAAPTMTADAAATPALSGN